MGERELLPLEKAAERLGVTRATMWRRTKEWGLTVYRNPVNKRHRLLDWVEVERARQPSKIDFVALGEQVIVEKGALLERLAASDDH